MTDVDTVSTASQWGKNSRDVIARELDEPTHRSDSADPASSLTFRSIRWGLTINLGDYHSARLDAEALVPPDTDPAVVLAQIQIWVAGHAPASQDDREEIGASLQDLKLKLKGYKAEVDNARDQWFKVKRVLEHLGVDLSRDEIQDLPF